jgi:nucleotide-binding universal stress UspA family protein
MADEVNADMIVLSSRGQSGKEAELGHIAHNVIRRASVPVHVVKP